MLVDTVLMRRDGAKVSPEVTYKHVAACRRTGLPRTYSGSEYGANMDAGRSEMSEDRDGAKRNVLSVPHEPHNG